MQGVLYEESYFLQWLMVTLLGAGGAWMTGRACAQTWRGVPNLVFFLLLLGVGVRFIHHALFDATMFSLHYYVIDTIILVVVGLVGYQRTRTNQMVTQYNWLYERASPLTWKDKG